jgi:hypothetical protein
MEAKEFAENSCMDAKRWPSGSEDYKYDEGEKHVTQYPSWTSAGATKRALSCLALSQAVYETTEEAMIMQLNNDLKSTRHGLVEAKLSTECAQRYALALKPSTRELYVAFRGTADLSDVLVDLNILGSSTETLGRFHDGFYQRAAQLSVGPFAAFLDANPGYRLVFCGHSLGGAVATIATLIFLEDLRINNPEENAQHREGRVNCVTFASPLCCHESAAMRASDLYARFFNHYVNERDLVPELLTLTETVRHRSNSGSVPSDSKARSVKPAITSEALSDLVQTATTCWKSAFSENQNEQNATWFSRMTPPLLPLVQKLVPMAIETLIPVFAPMGQYIQIKDSPTIKSKTTVLEGNVSVTVTTSTWECKRMDTSSGPGAVMLQSAISSVRDAMNGTPGHSLFESVKHHKIGTYRTQLCQRILTGRPLHSLPEIRDCAISSSTSMLGKFFIVCRDDFQPKRCDESPSSQNQELKQTQLLYSVVCTKLDKLEELHVTLHGVKARLTSGIRVVATEYQETPARPVSDSDACVSYTLFLPLARRHDGLFSAEDYRLELMTHFGCIQGLCLDPDHFNKGEVLKGRMRQIAELDIQALYTLAFTYSLYCGSRDLAPEAKVGNPSNTSNPRLEVLERLLRCTDRFEQDARKLADNPTFSRDAMKYLKQVALDLQHDEQVTTMQPELSQKTLLESKGNQPQPGRSTSLDWTDLRRIQREWLAPDSKLCSTDAILASQVVIYATFTSMFKRLQHASNVGTEQLIRTGIAVGCGFLVAIPCGMFIFGSTLAFSATMGTLGAAVAFKQAHKYIQLLNQAYLQILREWVKSLGLDTDRVRNNAFSLEEVVHDQYMKKFKRRTHDFIEDNWTDLFPSGSLRILKKSERKHAILVLETISDHFEMRQLLARDVAVGVVGPGKTGKSTLLQAMFGCETNPDPLIRTLDLATYRVHDRLLLVDFPHMTSELERLRFCYRANHSLVHAIVVVLSASQGGDDAFGELRCVVDTAKRFAKTGTRVLYCFNAADRLLKLPMKARMSRHPTSRIMPSHRGPSEGKHNVTPVQPPGLTRENLEQQLRQNALKYDIPPEDCLFTAFDLDVNLDPAEMDDKIEALEALGIFSPNYVKHHFIAKVLKQCGTPESVVMQIVADRAD